MKKSDTGLMFSQTNVKFITNFLTYKLLAIFIFIYCSSCTKPSEVIYSSEKPGDVSALDYKTMSYTSSNYDVNETLSPTASFGVTNVTDSLTKANSLEIKSGRPFGET